MKVRRAVEAYAIEQAERWYRSRGYEVDSSKARNNPYDLECKKAGESLHVEVKGTQGSGDQVFLTEGEKQHLGKYAPRCRLFIQYKIRVAGMKPPRALGGYKRVVEAIRLLKQGEFQPTQYRVRLPR